VSMKMTPIRATAAATPNHAMAKASAAAWTSPGASLCLPERP
jgi:hypothetical protein